MGEAWGAGQVGSWSLVNGASGRTHGALAGPDLRGHDRRPSATRDVGPHQTPSAGDSIVNFSVYGTVKMKFLPFISHPIYSGTNRPRQTPIMMEKI